LLADAMERQAQRAGRAETVATSRETPLPRIARAPSAYAPIRAVLHPPPGLLLRAGTSIPATLITHISSEVAGPVQAVVNHTVYGIGDDERGRRRPIIPAGTRLFGFNEGRASLGDRRLAIAWNRLQFADGRTLVLERVATTDGQGTAGVAARVANRWPSFYFPAFLTSITGATAQLSQRRGSRGNGELSGGEEAAAALGRNLSEVTRQVAERNLSRAPILEVRAGASLVVMLTEDLVFMQPPKPPGRSRPEGS
jgi:type IV secretion system protein VirB10